MGTVQPCAPVGALVNLKLTRYLVGCAVAKAVPPAASTAGATRIRRRRVVGSQHPQAVGEQLLKRGDGTGRMARRASPMRQADAGGHGVGVVGPSTSYVACTPPGRERRWRVNSRVACSTCWAVAFFITCAYTALVMAGVE